MESEHQLCLLTPMIIMLHDASFSSVFLHALITCPKLEAGINIIYPPRSLRPDEMKEPLRDFIDTQEDKEIDNW